MRKHFRFLNQDPRHFQILALGSLITFVFLFGDFAPDPVVFVFTILMAIATQFALFRFFKIPSTDMRSPIITALSLTLLLKSNLIWVVPLAAMVAMVSKFTIRINNKHIFNPANFAIILALIFLPSIVWVSPGQWGAAALTAFILICLAALVLTRARRGDIALFFLGAWATLIFGRALWLGDPLSIPMHNMQSGALLIFAFFMISDPKTTPDHRWGRLIFACVTAIIGFGLQYGLQVREGIFYALFITCLATPLLDLILKSSRYQWRTAQ